MKNNKALLALAVVAFFAVGALAVLPSSDGATAINEAKAASNDPASIQYGSPVSLPIGTFDASTKTVKITYSAQEIKSGVDGWTIDGKVFVKTTADTSKENPVVVTLKEMPEGWDTATELGATLTTLPTEPEAPIVAVVIPIAIIIAAALIIISCRH